MTADSTITVQHTPPAPASRIPRPPRFLLLGSAAASMVVGLNGALLLLALPAPLSSDRLPGTHGMVMSLGFLGTLIALERAVALREMWALLGPALLGGGALALITPAPIVAGQLLLLNGCAVLVAVYISLWRRSTDPTVLVQLLGAVLAGCAVALWIHLDVVDMVTLVATFLVLTIAAERVELARFTLPPAAPGLVLVGGSVLAGAAMSTLLWPEIAGRVFGLGLIALAGYLAWHDIARRTITSRGLPRYAAAAMLAGYLWLLVAGLTWAATGRPAMAGVYDLAVHAIVVGFALSMVMAHAPIILPAVLGIRLPYHRALWVALVALHLGMLVRAVALLAGHIPLWQTGSLGIIAALLLLGGTAVILAVRR